MIVRLRLLAPMAHGEFTVARATDHVQGLRRLPVVMGGRQTLVPALSGNALRGRLRRLVARDMFNALRIDSSDPRFAALYRTAANGGHLDGHDSAVTPARRDRVRAACPPLSLFGAAMGKWMLPGRVSVGICWPETVETVEAGLCDAEAASDLPHLADVETTVFHSRLPDAADGQAKPMPHGTEVVVAGVVLQSRIVATDDRTTDVERGCFAHGLQLLRAVGGGEGKGMGRVELASTIYADAGAWTQWLASDGRAEEMLAVVADET